MSILPIDRHSSDTCILNDIALETTNSSHNRKYSETSIKQPSVKLAYLLRGHYSIPRISLQIINVNLTSLSGHLK